MPRTPQHLDVRQITDTNLTKIYTQDTGVLAGIGLVITNAAASANTISVYHNDGNTDYLLRTRKLAPFIGKAWIVSEVASLKLNPGDSIKVQATAATAYNTNLSGSEVT
jgi:hypothetical protein